jgi:uncharacterized protein YdhG (YjbR/CyaY superfamily)
MTDVDEYLAALPAEAQRVVRAVREAIKVGAPNSVERMRYGMPAIQIHGTYWLHFAGWKNHVGLYPVPFGDAEFEDEIAEFRSAKDSVTFLYSKAIPYALITRITEHVRASCTSPSPH